MGSILGPDRHRKAPRWDQEGHQELQRPKKLHLQQPSKPFSFFKVFGVQRPPKRALGGPRRLPRGSRRAPRPNKKGIQKWAPKLSICGRILGPFWGPFWVQNWLQKGPKNGTTFGTLLLRISGVGGVAFLRIKRECCKSYCDWNYTRQKKGRDKALKSLVMALKESIRPLRGL